MGDRDAQRMLYCMKRFGQRYSQTGHGAFIADERAFYLLARQYSSMNSVTAPVKANLAWKS